MVRLRVANRAHSHFFPLHTIYVLCSLVELCCCNLYHAFRPLERIKLIRYAHCSCQPPPFFNFIDKHYAYIFCFILIIVGRVISDLVRDNT